MFTSTWAIAGAMLPVPANAQTATVAQAAQVQATPDQKNLPQIRVSGNRPKSRGNVKKPYAGAQIHTAPNPVRTPPVPGNVVGPVPNSSITNPVVPNGPATNPLAGIPATPLRAVAQSASRLNLPVLETPASVDIVTQQTMQDQGYRTSAEIGQGAVGVLDLDSAGGPANFSIRGFTYSAVNVLYNGILIPVAADTSRVTDLAYLDQVEFLKGPSALMSGIMAIGGSVNYVTKQPTTGPIQNELYLGYPRTFELAASAKW